MSDFTLTRRERETIIYALDVLLVAFDCGDDPTGQDEGNDELCDRSEIVALRARLEPPVLV